MGCLCLYGVLQKWCSINFCAFEIKDNAQSPAGPNVHGLVAEAQFVFLIES